MRQLFAAALCALAAVAAPGAAAADEGGWSYAYTDGVATATMSDDRGRPEATLTCRPPTGDLTITDWTLERAARRAETAAVRLGALTINVPVTRERIGRKRAAVIPLPQRPPILAAVRESDRLTVTIGGQSHTYLEGAAKQMKDVAFACWGS